MNKEKRKRLKLEMKVCIATDSVEINKLWAQWKKEHYAWNAPLNA